MRGFVIVSAIVLYMISGLMMVDSVISIANAAELSRTDDNPFAGMVIAWSSQRFVDSGILFGVASLMLLVNNIWKRLDDHCHAVHKLTIEQCQYLSEIATRS